MSSRELIATDSLPVDVTPKQDRHGESDAARNAAALAVDRPLNPSRTFSTENPREPSSFSNNDPAIARGKGAPRRTSRFLSFRRRDLPIVERTECRAIQWVAQVRLPRLPPRNRRGVAGSAWR